MDHHHDDAPTWDEPLAQPGTWRGEPLIRPLILRPTEPVSNDEFGEVCAFVAGTPYPIIVLNRKWEVI